MEQVKEFFTHDRYAQLSGNELLSVAPGHAVTQMQIAPRLSLPKIQHVAESSSISLRPILLQNRLMGAILFALLGARHPSSSHRPRSRIARPPAPTLRPSATARRTPGATAVSRSAALGVCCLTSGLTGPLRDLRVRTRRALRREAQHPQEERWTRDHLVQNVNRHPASSQPTAPISRGDSSK